MEHCILLYVGTILVAFEVSSRIAMLPLVSFGSIFTQLWKIPKFIYTLFSQTPRSRYKQKAKFILGSITFILYVPLSLSIYSIAAVITLPFFTMKLLLYVNRLLNVISKNTLAHIPPEKLNGSGEQYQLKRKLLEMQPDLPFLGFFGLVLITVGFILELV